MAKFDVDEDLVRRLSELLNEADLTELEISSGDQTIRLARGTTIVQGAPIAAPVVAGAAPAAEPATATAGPHPGAVTAPMVGTAYLAPEPGAAHFVQTGDQVAEGDTLLLIEAMKTFNPVRAPRSGTVTKIIVSDSAPVEFGEELMIIE